MSNSPFNQRVVATNIQGVPVSTGPGMETCNVGIKRPMPCIVILVHGVNDVGEAYKNQEEGIIKGLNERMGRTDMSAHEWHQFKMDMGDGEQQQIKKPGRSPVIPFYWGYKPVDHATYIEDQRRYRAEVDKLGSTAKLAYDAYQEDDKARLEKLGHISSTTLKYSNDNFGNVLDDVYAKGGGTFANATTTIPDMLGPGAGGLMTGAAGFMSLHMNSGDYTHPIYDNPHRIYQFFAAQRLADLIMTIRRNGPTQFDPINIVAHSQGTIITMLANMLVKQAGVDPADCVILNHSPYALVNTVIEGLTDGHHQTDRARQQTFINFCNLMKTNPKYNLSGLHTAAEIDELEGCSGLSKTHSKWSSNDLYKRNNFGKIYNYFCPNDSIVSLMNVQGLGWRGIPQDIAGGLSNLRQRVFCENGPLIGASPLSTPFEMPGIKKGAFIQDTAQTKEYVYSDVVINGEQLPVPFNHTLQGADSGYKSPLDPESPDQTISFSAKANALKRSEVEVKNLSWLGFDNLAVGHQLTPVELKMFSIEYHKNYIKGEVFDSGHNHKMVQLTSAKTPEELEKEWMQSDPIGYSQHSSIVASKDVPEKAMVFDLAVGKCKAFDFRYGAFWIELLQRADWRNKNSLFVNAVEYYRSGKLDVRNTKPFMNRPEEILPKGEFGVVNEYYNATTTRPAMRNEIHNREESNLQWKMPKALNV
ncbi:DUF3274 domain-containing protein [Scandinavium sp. H11S7]|uniref:DUF3274 domain-containing protein n=1 Tax=Scandinavium hiltneri TaxID=2926519 RepID=UPI002166B2E0|nr:DUF3274 domain-containing protein [Scandinavium hiltneri]MCS2155968.1 DUF3274 domain-containing protein [Scandinavium hiltneri]